MIVLISIDREFDNQEELQLTLDEIKKDPNFVKFISVDHKAVLGHKLVEITPIAWGDLDDDEQFIKKNKFGKKYNSRAPELAAKKVVALATHIVEFGKGDYNINKLAKGVLTPVKINKQVTSSAKRYKF